MDLFAVCSDVAWGEPLALEAASSLRDVFAALNESTFDY
jgi:hypothetical protein